MWIPLHNSPLPNDPNAAIPNHMTNGNEERKGVNYLQFPPSYRLLCTTKHATCIRYAGPSVKLRRCGYAKCNPLLVRASIRTKSYSISLLPSPSLSPSLTTILYKFFSSNPHPRGEGLNYPPIHEPCRYIYFHKCALWRLTLRSFCWSGSTLPGGQD